MQHSLTILIGLAQCAFLVGGEGDERIGESADGRTKYMRSMLEAMEVEPANRDSKLAKRFNEKAILRFGDATRDASDGSLWKLGSGRPQVIVGMKFTRVEDALNLNYEFLCLTDERFELCTSQGWKWTPSQPALKFQRLQGVRPPHKSADVRFRELKRLARRFSAREQFNGEEYHLRLMSQPIDQYLVDEELGRQQGAVFVFAHGTNPEVLLLLESLDDAWQFGLARMCGAEASVKFDDDVIWTIPSMDNVPKSWLLDYTGDAHSVEQSVGR